MTAVSTQEALVEHKSIASALSAMQGELEAVAKGETAQVKSEKATYSYRYADLASITKVVYPLLAKHGLAFTVQPHQGPDGWQIGARLLHGASGESLEASLPLHGGSDPQRIGSALTYGRRYLLGCLTGVVTDEDDDAQKAQGSERVASKDWQAVITAARAAVSEEQLKQLWEAHDVANAPRTIGDLIRVEIDRVRASAGGEPA